MVDDGGHASYYHVVTIGQEIFSLAKLKGGIAVFTECVPFIGV
jgi:hypothetical protein